MNKTTVAELATRLMELPQEIHDLQIQILEKNQELTQVTNQQAVLETSLKMEIANQVDDAGKKVYSNADAREAAFVEARAKDLEITTLQSTVDLLQDEIQRKRILHEFLANEQRNLRSLLAFFANETEITL